MRSRFRFALVFVVLLVATAPALAADAPRLPVTPRKPVTDVYQGQSVVDDYRWLEDAHDPAVHAWSDSQNVVARDWLDHAPGRADILARVTALNKDITPRVLRPARARRRDVRAQVAAAAAAAAHRGAALGRRPVAASAWSSTRTGSTRRGSTTIDFYVPSLDGTKVAVSLSDGGTEDGTVYVYDVGDRASG